MCHHETLAHQEEKLKKMKPTFIYLEKQQKMQGKTNNEDLCKIFIGGALYDLHS